MRLGMVVLIFLFCMPISAQQEDILLFQRDEFKIYLNKAIYPDNILYDTSEDIKSIVNLGVNDPKCAEGIKIIYNPLSLVGNYYSYEKNLFDPGGGGDCYRNPSSDAAVNTINISSGEKTSLLELVDEDSLVTALKNDFWVRDMYGTMDNAELDSKTTFKEVLALINSNMGFGIKFRPDSFALLSYDRSSKLLALRLIGIKYLGYDNSRHIQLGLYVRPKSEMEIELEKEKGFFLGKFKNGLM